MNRIQKKLKHFMLLVICVFIPLHAFTQNEDIMKKLDLSDEYYITGFGYFEQKDYVKALPYFKKSYEKATKISFGKKEVDFILLL